MHTFVIQTRTGLYEAARVMSMFISVNTTGVVILEIESYSPSGEGGVTPHPGLRRVVPTHTTPTCKHMYSFPIYYMSSRMIKVSNLHYGL